MKNTSLYLLIIILVSGCSNQRTNKWLSLAESYSTINPDSTLFYLGKIKDMENLSEINWAKYQLYRTKAEMWKSQKQPSDSIILKAADLFIEQKDSTSVSDAFFRAGLINYFAQNYLRADSLFGKGIQFTQTPVARVPLYEYRGYNSLSLEKPAEALTYHLMALQDSSDAPTDWMHFLLSDVGRAYQLNGMNDSAVYYYFKAIEKVENKPDLLSLYYSRLTDIYSENGNFDEAIKNLKTSINFKNSRQAVPRNMLAYAKIFLSAGEPDSARIYLQKAIQSPNMYIATRAYQYLAEMYEPFNNNSILFSKWDTYKKSFNNVSESINTEVLQKRYQDELLRNENNELKLKQKQKDIYLLSLGLVLIVICALAYIIYNREKKKKILAQFQQERELIILREKTITLREQLFRKLSVSQKIPSLSGKQKDTINDINTRLTPEDMEELMQTVDSIWPGFAAQLQTTYPLLKPKDITFCCLLKSGISVKDLASIYYVTPSAISQKKARMKREKFGIKDDTKSLDEILLNF